MRSVPASRALPPSLLARTAHLLVWGGYVACLLGYAALGKGFSYWHIPRTPLYVGEILLLLTLPAWFASRRMFERATAGGAAKVLLALMLLGVARTVPYVRRYGLAAFRDGVIYGYGYFMLLVAGLICRRDQVLRVYSRLELWTIRFVLASPAIVVASFWLRDQLPRVPDSTVPLACAKQGDMAVLLGGAIVFLLVVPATRPRRHPNLLLMIALVSLLPCIASRGGMLAVSVGVFIASLLRPTRLLYRLVGAGVVAIALLALLGPTLSAGRRRGFGLDEFAVRIESIVNPDVEEGNYAGTRRWRLEWWKRIIDETVFGPLFWKGRGFGEVLSIAYGMKRETADSASRSPHSIHMAMLARMGVPGALLWLLLQTLWLAAMLRARGRARASGDALGEGLIVWVLCCWAMATTRASFGIYLEAPHGGIPYWTLMGFGAAIATALQQTTTTRQAPAGKVAA